VIFDLARKVLKYAEYRTTAPASELRDGTNPFADIVEFWKTPIKGPWRFLVAGFKVIARPLVRWTVAFIVTYIGLGWLLAAGGITSAQSKELEWLFTIMVYGISLLVSAFSLPSTFVDAGVRREHVAAIMATLTGSGMKSEPMLDAIESQLSQFASVSDSRISKLRWTVAAAWAVGLFLLQRLYEAAVTTPTAAGLVTPLAGFSVVAILGTLFLHTFVESYAAASTMVFRTTTTAVTELRSQLHDPETYGRLAESTGSIEGLLPTFKRAWKQMFMPKKASEVRKGLGQGEMNTPSESADGQPPV
jgi:hypothetical protein